MHGRRAAAAMDATATDSESPHSTSNRDASPRLPSFPAKSSSRAEILHHRQPSTSCYRRVDPPSSTSTASINPLSPSHLPHSRITDLGIDGIGDSMATAWWCRRPWQLLYCSPATNESRSRGTIWAASSMLDGGDVDPTSMVGWGGVVDPAPRWYVVVRWKYRLFLKRVSARSSSAEHERSWKERPLGSKLLVSRRQLIAPHLNFQDEEGLKGFAHPNMKPRSVIGVSSNRLHAWSITPSRLTTTDGRLVDEEATFQVRFELPQTSTSPTSPRRCESSKSMSSLTIITLVSMLSDSSSSSGLLEIPPHLDLPAETSLLQGQSWYGDEPGETSQRNIQKPTEASLFPQVTSGH
ncbi:hypothetical protein Dimus_000309 [Dionaea muscipula]